MRILEKMIEKQKDLYGQKCVTIAFLGDSVTQGCFEIYPDGAEIGVVFDEEHVYHNCLRKMLGYLYPAVPINIIKAGISGSRAESGLERLDRDVLQYHPDLVVVCFGLNDAGGGKENISNYGMALSRIFARLKEKNIEVIFMTPNMMNTKVSPKIQNQSILKIAEEKKEIQNQGILDLYVDEARRVCEVYDIPLCDCYKKWKALKQNGVDTTALLSNHINHPTREMHWLFAISLLEIMMEETV